ncbi:MAG: DNA repair protein RadC [Anaerolineae bacterium]|nr:DNA repair protein RadC [Anaerolineae bacterium]
MTNYKQRDNRRHVRDMAVADQPMVRQQQYGGDALSTAELLANVLQTHDALDLAIDMLAAFGDLPSLARATVPQLRQFDGVGEAQAMRLKAAFALGKRLFAQTTGDVTRIASPADAANLLMAEMQHLEQEHLRVILLDTRNRVIGVRTLYIGNVNTSIVRMAEVFRPAIAENAPAIIVAHNHPSGDASPSPEDIGITRTMVAAGKTLGVDVLDHIIIGAGRFVSLKERGLGFM